MKNIIWIIILSIIFLAIFRFLRKLFAIKKVFKDALNQSRSNFNQNNTQQKSNIKQQSFDKPKYNIEAETVDYEIIEEQKKDEK